MSNAESRFDVSPAYLTGLLGAKVESVDPMDGGRNSQTFKVTAEDGFKYAAKLYLGTTADGKSRLEVEFSSLEFLYGRGIDCVPRPVAADRIRQCAVYEFVEGAKVDCSQATPQDIGQASQFLLRLHELKHDRDSGLLPAAAEACFSVQAIVSNLEARLTKLRGGKALPSEDAALRDFLDTEFLPAFREIGSWCRQRVIDAGATMDSELEPEERTLSPSDFGFHNCIRRDGGELVFLDFEYFGWDDPAKMVCDFILHPAMDLGASLKQRFVDSILARLDSGHCLATRIETVYPLFALKWCLILLNPFLSHYRQLRGLPDRTGPDQGGLLMQQLEKSRRRLTNIWREYAHFPYRGATYAPIVG